MQTFAPELFGCNEALDSGMSGAEATEHEAQQTSELYKNGGRVFHPAAISRGNGAGRGKARDGGAVGFVSTAAGAQHERPLNSNALQVRYKHFVALRATMDFEVARFEDKAVFEPQDLAPEDAVHFKGGDSGFKFASAQHMSSGLNTTA